MDSARLFEYLDHQGTRTMMKQLMGEAGSVTDFDTEKKRLCGCWYWMDFTRGYILTFHVHGRCLSRQPRIHR